MKWMLVLVFCVPSLLATEETEKVARELMKVSGSAELGDQVLDQIMMLIKPLAPEISDEFWEAFRKEVNTDDLIELVVPIYAKHLSIEEMKGVVAFYQTPAGKALASKQGVIAQESMVAGQAWGEKLGEKILNSIKEEGSKK